jgi:hypothetical protein
VNPPDHTVGNFDYSYFSDEKLKFRNLIAKGWQDSNSGLPESQSHALSFCEPIPSGHSLHAREKDTESNTCFDTFRKVLEAGGKRRPSPGRGDMRECAGKAKPWQRGHEGVCREGQALAEGT